MTALSLLGKEAELKLLMGIKGKGVLIHLLVDAQGMPLSALSAPANEDERKHVGYLLEAAEVKTGKAGRPRKKVSRLAADKGYNLDSLRIFFERRRHSAADSKKEECEEKTWTACQHESSKISSRTRFLMAPEKVSEAC